MNTSSLKNIIFFTVYLFILISCNKEHDELPVEYITIKGIVHDVSDTTKMIGLATIKFEHYRIPNYSFFPSPKYDRIIGYGMSNYEGKYELKIDKSRLNLSDFNYSFTVQASGYISLTPKMDTLDLSNDLNFALTAIQ